MIALSYSRLNTYETCPRKFQSQYITKTYLDESDNPHFVRGSKIHKQLEEYVLSMVSASETFGNLPSLSPEAQNATSMIKSIFSTFDEIYAEQQIAVNKDFDQISWFSKDAYYRAILDLVAIKGDMALIVDWKTGKVREYESKPTGQLHLASAILMAIKPQIQTVKTAYAFVEHQHTIAVEFTRDQLSDMLMPFHDAIEEVNKDTEFKPKPNRYCFFCKIDSSECEFKK